MFHSQVIHRTDGTLWAVRSHHKTDIDNVDAVPGDSIQLESTDDLAERELALRLWFDGGYEGPVHHAGNMVFTLNFRGVEAHKVDPAPYFNMVTGIKAKMTSNGADQGVLNAPGAAGYGTAMSYIGGEDSDSDVALFMKAVCTGQTWAVSIWNGERPDRMPGDRPSRSADDGQFLVLTESEAEGRAEAAANAKANEVEAGFEGDAASYFDRERYVMDQMNGEGAGKGFAALLSCDNEKHTLELEGEGLTFVAFRVA